MSTNTNQNDKQILNFFSKRLRYYIMTTVSVLLCMVIIKIVVPAPTADVNAYASQGMYKTLDIITFIGIVTLIPAVIGSVVISRISANTTQ